MSNSILDFLISMKNSKINKGLIEFLNNNNFSSSLSDKQHFFWNLITENNNSNQKENRSNNPIPNYISDEQLNMEEAIKKSKNIDISAPTSFGKSYLLIKKIIMTKGIRIVISPTISLCNEYFIKILEKIKEINIDDTPSMSPFSSASIYILTPEKYLSLHENKIIGDSKIELIIFDEFYEAFAGDRYPIFEEAYIKSTEIANKVIKVLPHKNVNIPHMYKSDDSFKTEASATMRRVVKYEVTKNKISAKWVSTEFNKNKSNGFKVTSKFNTENEVFEDTIKNTTNNTSTIVLSSKRQMFEKLEYVSKFYEKSNDPLLIEIEKYLIENAKYTMLAKYIRHGVAYHNGTMDKFLRILIERSFTMGKIRVLFGNSAITKGVNLSPDILYIMKYKGARGSLVSDAIKKIEKINTFGRTGRSIAGKNIGTIIMFSRSGKNKDDYLIKGNDESLEIKKPEIDSPNIVGDFESAYKKYIVNKGEPIISKVDRTNLLNYINDDVKIDRSEKIQNLFSAIENIYEIKFNPGLRKKRIFLIRTYLMKQGYSFLAKQNRISAIETGYITKTGGYSKNGNEKSVEFRENTFHEDLIVNESYEQYENIAGFYFYQLFKNALKLISNNEESNKIIEKYISKISEEESVATKKGWPDSFGDYYNFKRGAPGVEKYLEKMLKLIN